MTITGKQVADLAFKRHGHNPTSGGRCLDAVQDILDEIGLKTDRVPSAYLAPTSFDRSVIFNKYYSKSSDNHHNLDTLPPGTIIVFGPVANHPHGHIEIKAPAGSAWISDYCQNRRIAYGGVKIPIATYIPKA